MVSGFFTSPYDHERIFSGEASPVLIASNSSSCVTCLNRSSSAFMRYSRVIPWPSSFPRKRESSVVRRKTLGPRVRGDDDPCDTYSQPASVPLQVDIDRQRADFLHQHVERLRHAGLDLVLALDDVLVDLGPAVDVVGLDREHLLQRVGSAVGFERPDFHFAEALAAELGLATQRLLGHE